jgi:hypothetical protein
MVLAASCATPANADNFPWYDDPDSSLSTGPFTISGDTLTRVLGVDNIGAAHDIGLVITQFNTTIGGVDGNLVWDQTLQGWAGSVGGDSLLVTVTSPSGSLPWNEVADPTGTVQDTFTYFGQATDPAATYPFFDFGIVPAGGTPSTTFDFLFTWGGTDKGVPLTGMGFASVAPNPSAIPEPSSFILLATLVFTFVFGARKRIARDLNPATRTNS